MEKNENIVTNANKSGYEKRNVPTLRFKTFEQKWEYSTIGECSISLEYGMNATAIKYDGKHKYIRITDIDEETSAFIPNPLSSPDGELEEKYLVKENDILFARTGASVGKSYLYNNNDGELYFAGFLIRARIKSEYNGTFIYYQTKSKKYDRWVKLTSMRSGQPGINSQEYSSYPIALTSKDEQDKIADFLQLLDNRISVQNKIIEDLKILKKELCNDHFKSVLHDASLRYITLKEILTERKEYCSKDGTYTHGTLSKEGVAPKTERYDRDFLVKNEDKQYKVTHLNDICYNPANLKFGVICRNTYGDLIFSPIYVTFEISDNVYPAYIELFLTNPNFIGRIRRYEQGTVYERMAVSPEDFLSYETHIPAYEEQVEFANEMQRIQRKIELETAFLSSLQNQRRFFLNAMFI